MAEYGVYFSSKGVIRESDQSYAGANILWSSQIIHTALWVKRHFIEDSPN